MITALTPPANGTQAMNYLTQARDIANRVAAATGPQAAPLPTFDEVKLGAQHALEASKFLGTNPSAGGCVYGPSIESAAILAKAGADALDKAALGLQTCSGMENYELLKEGSVVAAHVLDDAMTSLKDLPADVLGIEPQFDGTPCGH